MKILLKKEISEYYTSDFAQMFNDLFLIKKDRFLDNERIIFTSFGITDVYIWKHFRKIIQYLDIPTFFIEIHTNNKDIDNFVNNNYCEKISILFKNVKKIDNIIDKKFYYPDSICINPFINLEIDNNGNYKPCCEYKKSLGKYNVVEDNIETVWNSQEIKKIRKDFLLGKQLDACSKCWNLEKNGKISKRIRDNNYYFRDYFYKINWYNNKQKLKSIDIKLGNACNLSCRICNYSLSSSWYKEIKDNLDKWNLKSPPTVRLVDWPYNKDTKFWKSLEDNAVDLEYLQFVGGEPLLNKQHLTILEFLIDKDLSKNILIHYNTNGTIWPSDRHFSLLEKFKKVGISLSIDNLYCKFEYERYGNSWNQVEKNIQKFASLNKSHYEIDIFTTVSIFNVLDLLEIDNFFTKKDIPVSYNLLESPSEFSIKNIPMDKRNYIIEKISNSNSKGYNFVLSLLNENNFLNQIEEFHKHINIVDNIRKQKFKEYYPEMSKIMNF